MKLQGNEILSLETRRAGQRLIAISAAVLSVKAFRLNLDDLSVLSVSLPASLFDVVAFAILLFGAITFVFNWVGDLTAFKKWYQEREIWSQFQTNMTLDGTFYSSGLKLLMRLHELDSEVQNVASIDELPADVRKDFTDLKTNLELWTVRLEEHQRDFTTVSRMGKFYIFVLWGAIPAIFTFTAIVTLICTGDFQISSQL